MARVKSDDAVGIPGLRRRIADVRDVQARGTVAMRSAATGLLVSDTWLRDALEARVLALEDLLVRRIGVEVRRCSMCDVEVVGGIAVSDDKDAMYVVALRAKHVCLVVGDVLCDWCREHVGWYKRVTEGL